MRYMIIKYVDAANHAEAMRKAKRTPIHEITIHNSHWEKTEFSLKDTKANKIGFKDATKKTGK